MLLKAALSPGVVRFGRLTYCMYGKGAKWWPWQSTLQVYVDVDHYCDGNNIASVASFPAPCHFSCTKNVRAWYLSHVCDIKGLRTVKKC